MKNTKSLLYHWWTLPPNWAAKHNNAAESIQYAIIQELGMTPQDSVMTPMGEFSKRLKPLPSPYLEKGRLSESASRGKEIYISDNVDCNKCHPAPLFTDTKFQPTIVTDQWDASPNFDTPSIIEAWRTAPWDHIGTTIDFETLLKNPRHSNCAQKLSDDEFRDLMEYVLSL
jgi:hypothetical protein